MMSSANHLRVKYRAQFLLGWVGAACRTECMLHSIVMIENVMTFTTAVHILFTSFVYRKNVYWSVTHGIRIKPHLSVTWSWFHFVAIAILHQPRPTDSADINTWLQLSDTSSTLPMHVGFLLVSQKSCAKWRIFCRKCSKRCIQNYNHISYGPMGWLEIVVFPVRSV